MPNRQAWEGVAKIGHLAPHHEAAEGLASRAMPRPAARAYNRKPSTLNVLNCALWIARRQADDGDLRFMMMVMFAVAVMMVGIDRQHLLLRRAEQGGNSGWRATLSGSP